MRRDHEAVARRCAGRASTRWPTPTALARTTRPTTTMVTKTMDRAENGRVAVGGEQEPREIGDPRPTSIGARSEAREQPEEDEHRASSRPAGTRDRDAAGQLTRTRAIRRR